MDGRSEQGERTVERHAVDGQDRNADGEPRSALPRSLLSGYQAEMQRRWSADAVLRERRSRRTAFWVVFYLLAALAVWRLVIYAVDLTAYLRLSLAGTTTQATVLRKQTEGGASVESPDRFIITYGFWAGSSPYIQREKVSGETFLALGVEGPVEVVYLWRQPQLARIVRELVFPWRLDAIAITVICIVLFAARRTLLRDKVAPASPTPADA